MFICKNPSWYLIIRKSWDKWPNSGCNTNFSLALNVSYVSRTIRQNDSWSSYIFGFMLIKLKSSLWESAKFKNRFCWNVVYFWESWSRKILTFVRNSFLHCFFFRKSFSDRIIDFNSKTLPSVSCYVTRNLNRSSDIWY